MNILLTVLVLVGASLLVAAALTAMSAVLDLRWVKRQKWWVENFIVLSACILTGVGALATIVVACFAIAGIWRP
jgi:hypothetical protein